MKDKTTLPLHRLVTVEAYPGSDVPSAPCLPDAPASASCSFVPERTLPLAGQGRIPASFRDCDCQARSAEPGHSVRSAHSAHSAGRKGHGARRAPCGTLHRDAGLRDAGLRDDAGPYVPVRPVRPERRARSVVPGSPGGLSALCTRSAKSLKVRPFATCDRLAGLLESRAFLRYASRTWSMPFCSPFSQYAFFADSPCCPCPHGLPGVPRNPSRGIVRNLPKGPCPSALQEACAVPVCLRNRLPAVPEHPDSHEHHSHLSLCPAASARAFPGSPGHRLPRDVVQGLHRPGARGLPL